MRDQQEQEDLEDIGARDALMWAVGLVEALTSTEERYRRASTLQKHLAQGNTGAVLLTTGLMTALQIALPSADPWSQARTYRFDDIDVGLEDCAGWVTDLRAGGTLTICAPLTTLKLLTGASQGWTFARVALLALDPPIRAPVIERAVLRLLWRLRLYGVNLSRGPGQVFLASLLEFETAEDSRLLDLVLERIKAPPVMYGAMRQPEQDPPF